MRTFILAFLTMLAATGCAGSHPEADQLVKSAESGSAEAQMKLAVAYVADPDPTNHAADRMRVAGIPFDEAKGLYWYRKAAENGHGPAQIVMGLNYSFGHGVPVDFKQALAWFRKAEARHAPNAKECIDSLRVILDSPVRSDADKQAVRDAFADETKTTTDLIRLAMAGDTIASRRSGERLWDGMGVAQDYKEGLKFLRYAAEHGDREAQGFLGSIYATGNGVSQDFTEGAKWLRKAADQSDPVAQFNLALSYFRGEGVQADEMEGLKLLKLAASNGNVGAKKILEKGEADAKMTAESKPKIEEPPAPAPQKPTDVAVKNSIAYLDSMMGKGNYTVENAVGLLNDMEATNVSYPITTIIEVRFRGISPTGYIKRTATFACLADGRVMQPITLPSQ